MGIKFPQKLNSGDEVALIAPSGPLSAERISGAVKLLKGFGLGVRIRDDACNREGFHAGSDHRRFNELKEALEDEAIKAVFCLRGGYGVQRILNGLDLSPRQSPKAVVGFSDNTALLGLLNSRHKWAVVHGPHPQADKPEETREVLACLGLFGEPALPLYNNLSLLAGGKSVTAPLAGGCLSILSTSVGTGYFPTLKGKIVFIEDVSENAYRIDRMLNHLKNVGAFEGAKAIVFGEPLEFRPADEDGALVLRVIEEFAQGMGFPVLYGLPCGHVKAHRPLFFGPRARLDPKAGTLEFVEAVVA